MSSNINLSDADAERELAQTNTDIENTESSIRDTYKFLPTITVAAFGVGIFVDPNKNALLVTPAALLGIGFTLLFWSIQRNSVEKLDELEVRKEILEDQLNRQPREPKQYSMINEHTRCAGIFSLILSGWFCLAIWYIAGPAIALILTLLAFLTLGGITIYNAHSRVKPQQVSRHYSR